MAELYDLDSERILVPGDVVMCSRKLRDKVTRKLFDWKFFMVVSEEENVFGDVVTGHVVGATNPHLKDIPLKLSVTDEKNVIYYLPMDEWPDGVHAFRMALIMQRKIEV